MALPSRKKRMYILILMPAGTPRRHQLNPGNLEEKSVECL